MLSHHYVVIFVKFKFCSHSLCVVIRMTIFDTTDFGLFLLEGLKFFFPFLSDVPGIFWPSVHIDTAASGFGFQAFFPSVLVVTFYGSYYYNIHICYAQFFFKTFITFMTRHSVMMAITITTITIIIFLSTMLPPPPPPPRVETILCFYFLPKNSKKLLYSCKNWRYMKGQLKESREVTLWQWYSTGGTRRHLMGYVKFKISIYILFHEWSELQKIIY
jgi:hypothetical protein